MAQKELITSAQYGDHTQLSVGQTTTMVAAVNAVHTVNEQQEVKITNLGNDKVSTVNIVKTSGALAEVTDYGKVIDAKLAKELFDTKQDSMIMGTPVAKDFNQLIKPGCYFLGLLSGYANAPTTNTDKNAMLEVASSQLGGTSERYIQTLTLISTTGNYTRYTRVFSSGWGPWSIVGGKVGYGPVSGGLPATGNEGDIFILYE